MEDTLYTSEIEHVEAVLHQVEDEEFKGVFKKTHEIDKERNCTIALRMLTDALVRKIGSGGLATGLAVNTTHEGSSRAKSRVEEQKAERWSPQRALLCEDPGPDDGRVLRGEDSVSHAVELLNSPNFTW